jgi:hypothetical protein
MVFGLASSQLQRIAMWINGLLRMIVRDQCSGPNHVLFSRLHTALLGAFVHRMMMFYGEQAREVKNIRERMERQESRG